MTKFHCVHCGAKIKATPDRAGTIAKCPQCSTMIRVPGIEAPPVVAVVEGSPAATELPVATRLKAFIKRKAWDYSMAFLVALGLMLAFVITVVVVIGRPESRARTYDQESTFANAGDTATLWIPSGGDVPLAVSQAAHDRMKKLANARDTDGIGRLIVAGIAGITPTGTKCRVIAAGFYTYEVRILDGPHAGDAVFVSADFVRRD